MLTQATSVFFDAQRSQLLNWLINYQLYLTVAVILLVSLSIPATAWKRRDLVSLVHDFSYGVVHTLVFFPLVAVYLFLLELGTERYCPWINLRLLSHLPWLGQIIIGMLLIDFLEYVSHYLRHKIRPLWYFHAIHHSQQSINPFTTKRTHIVEDLFSKGFVRWIPLAVLGTAPEVWVLIYMIDAAWDYLIHSNVRINLGPLRYVLVSPQYHRIHHSRLPDHFDRNFADRFVIWDLVFGTAYLNADEYPPTGIPDPTFPHETSLRPTRWLATYCAQWLYPFRRLAADACGWCKRNRRQTKPSLPGKP